MGERRVYSLHAAEKALQITAKRKSVKKQTSLHWHDCLEIELVLSGRGTNVINGKKYPLTRGTIYALTPADNHIITVEEPIELIGIMFSEEQISEDMYAALLTLEMSGVELIATPDEQKFSVLEQYASTILQEVGNQPEQPYTSAYVKSLLECIIIELLRAPRYNVPPSVNPLICRAVLYLHRHYTEQITLDSLAKHLHLTPTYLSAYFKNNTGCTFKQYLVNLRLKHACRLLVSTDFSVTEICLASGFSSYSHVMRSFNAHYGTTPVQYRKMNSTKKPV